MNTVTASELDAMSRIDIRTVDPDTLVDIREVTVDTSLPREERIRDFISKIKNPYCYKFGKFVVKVKFADNGETIDDRMESYLRSLA